MQSRSDKKRTPATWRLAAIAAVVCLAAGVGLADIVLAKAKSSWGTVKVERSGSDQDFVSGMDLENGDIVKTERKSGAVIEWLDRNGEVIGEESVYGLPGPDGCADADGDRGKSKIKIRGKNKPGNKRKTITELRKGTTLFKTRPGKEQQAKDHFVVDKRSVLKKKGTEVAMTSDSLLDQSSLSTLEGSADFDNIEWTSLPDGYFTDPFDKSFETIILDVVLTAASDVFDVSDILGAGNAVEVNTDFYSIAMSPPSTPLPGLAPIHKKEGGLCPEPATLLLLAGGAVALMRRKRK